MTLLEKLDRLPPFVCRLLARRRAGPKVYGMTMREISLASGLSKSTVADLSFRTTWAEIPVGVAEKFSVACGVDLLDVQDSMRYLQVGQMGYTEQGDINQIRMYTRLLRLRVQTIRPEER